MDHTQILQWNAKSLRPKTHDLCFLIRKYSPILVAVSETWFVPGSHYRVPGYSCLRDDRQDGYAGCALLVNRNLTFSQVVLPAHSAEINAVAVRVLNITFLSIYIPHPQSTLIPDILLIILSVPAPIIIMGDFNAHHTSWGSASCDMFGYSLLEIFDEANVCVINDGSPTRRVLPSQNPQSAVDLTVCSPSLSSDLFWEVLPVSYGSDHYPILIKIPQRTPPQCSPTSLLKHRLSGANWDSYSSSLEHKINLMPIPNSDPLSCYEKFIDSIISSANEHIPLKKPRCNRASPPWWDSECSCVARNRNEAEISYNFSMTLFNYLEYQRAASKARKILSTKKKHGWINFCESLSPTTPPSIVWKQIRKFRGYYNYINRSSNDPSSWLEAFANKLAPPFVHIALSFNIPNFTVPPSNIDALFSFDELQLALSDLVDSSPGLDGITYSFITKSPDKSKYYLLNLINIFYDQGFIPQPWITQIIIPILKPGKNPSDSNSYRPIALSCILAKITEHLIKNRLEWLAENKKLLAKSQFGFRKGMSTFDSLSILTTEINHSFRNKQYLVGVFLDIAAAYDNVLLPVLRNKLLQLSIPEKITRFICCFLAQRTILIKSHDNSYLSPRTVWKGLPQGSVLSPILYSLYTCDLETTVNPFCKVLQYADDLAIYISSKSIIEAEQNLNYALSYLGDWLLDHGLSISASKSSTVVFTRKRIIPTFNIQYERETIHLQSSVKFLGVWLDSRLTGVKHFDYVLKKCEKNINILRALSGVWWGSHPYCQKLLYNAIIRSHLDYGSFLLDPGNKAALNKLDKIQYKCLRIILGAMKSSPINSMQVECVEPPLHLRRQFLSDRFLFKLIQNSDHPLLKTIENLHMLLTEQGYTSEDNLPCIIRSFIKYLNLPSPVAQFQMNPLFTTNYDALIYQPSIILNFGINKNSVEPNKLFIYNYNIQWSDWLPIFTDASKLTIDSNVGASVWIPKYKIILSYKCPPLSSVFSGESVAILEAILYATSHSISKAIIFTDSKSCLQAIMSNQFKSKSRSPLVLKIKEALFSNHQAGLNVVLAWIPGHVGITGNETADSCAKLAASLGNLDQYIVYSHDLVSTCQLQLYTTWDKHWQKSKCIKGKFYGQLQISIPTKPWFFKFKKVKKVTTSTICRLRLGHSCTPVFLNKIRVRDHSLCECGLDEGTTEHIFFECIRLRFSLYDVLPPEIPRPTNFSFLLSLAFTPFLNILCKFIQINKIKL